MRVGIFGGTFNPPHLGHINMCTLFLEEMKLDKLIVIPACIPPHKQIKSKTTVEQRLEMSKIAFTPISNKIFVSDIETKREGKSYTADTIKEIKALGYNDLYFLCGTDMLLTLDTWYNPKYIFDNATIVYIRRESEIENEHLISNKIMHYKKTFDANIINIKAKPIELSSSIVRNAIKNGLDASNMLSKGVLEYIAENKLYENE